MKLPVKWLKSYIDITSGAQNLADLLTMSGTNVEGVEQLDGTDLLHLEITTNRPDCLSILGIAKEISALTGKKVNFKKISPPKPRSTERVPLQIKIQDQKGCPYYLGRVIEKVAVGPSPQKMQTQLSWMGQKPVNNVVDITNFVLYELGQPLHAFDYDKIRGGKIVVRRAHKNEKIIGINGIEYKLDERILVIADAQRPIAIAGVMGGLDTEVTASTKRVVLESAQFDPLLVRRASRFLKLTSDSSYRFERSVAPEKVRQASDRTANMILAMADAEMASKPIEAGKLVVPKQANISLSVQRLNEALGTELKKEVVVRILNSLGFKVSKKGSKDLGVRVPVSRQDVRQEADLFEEVARVYGYQKIPTTIPSTRHDVHFHFTDGGYAQIRDLKRILVGQGFYEAITFGLVSQEVLAKLQWPRIESLIRVENPASQEQEILRPTGLPGLLQVISHNVNRKLKDLSFFEIGKRFTEHGEEQILSLALTGCANASWENRKEASFYHLKGVVEEIFKALGKKAPLWQQAALLPQIYTESLLMYLGSTLLVYCAQVDRGVLEERDIAQNVYYAEIQLDALLAAPDLGKTYHELPQYPAVRRDISFLISNEVSLKRIEEVVAGSGVAHLNKFELFDEYKGKNIPKGKRSLAFSLEYQKKDATFTDDEIKQNHQHVLEALATQLAVEFR